MNTVNLQASVNNLSQVDRQQQYLHRTPIVNQEQNAEIAQEEAARRARMPVQLEQSEGKKIDPEDRRKESQRKGKKQQRNNDNRRPKPDSPHSAFIDVTA
jgi:hypothetical protein